MPETEKVPIGRLFTNLSLRLIKNTNDFELTYQLARLHSMAYATNLGEVSALKASGYPDRRQTRFSGLPDLVQTSPSPEARRVGLEHLTNAIALYERALLLLKRSTNARAWEVVRTQLGLAWCLDQSGLRGPALIAYRKALNTAWRMEVTGNGPFVGDSYCEEIIGYMMKLLDPEQDAKEIADLRERQQEEMKSLSFRRAYTPILLPLEAGASFRGLVDPAAGVCFDLDGSGIGRKWGWITPKAAWLVYDAVGCGQITSGLQMFGNVTFWIFWRDGYAALAALDDNSDGMLSGAELKDLALWCDANRNGVSEPGEVRPVSEFGITQIACSGEVFSEDTKWNSRGVTFSDGSTRPSYDWISRSE